MLVNDKMVSDVSFSLVRAKEGYCERKEEGK